MQMSQQPNMGPLSGLFAIENWTRLRGYFYLEVRLKMKLILSLSGAQCFLFELHATGVNPPMILPNYVSMRTRVSTFLSQALWNYLISYFF